MHNTALTKLSYFHIPRLNNAGYTLASSKTPLFAAAEQYAAEFLYYFIKSVFF